MLKINFKITGWLFVSVLAFTACEKEYLEFEYTDGAVREADITNPTGTPGAS